MCYHEDRVVIKKWLFSILLRKTFGASADNVLSQSRRAFTSDIEGNFLDQINGFPSKDLNTEIKKINDVGDDYISELLTTQKDDRYSFPILAMLYPDLDYKNNNFHKDHLHPASSYNMLEQKDKDNYGWNVYNSILNLQMLDSNENMSKNAMPLKDWIEEQTKDIDKNKFLENHLIPKVDYDVDNFEEFIEARKEILIDKLKRILN